MSGVENAGNTCVLSSLLQELASLGGYYDVLFNTQLDQAKQESTDDFASRKALQKALKAAIEHLRSGRVVSASDVQEITRLLLALGWQKDTISSVRKCLHAWLPKLFFVPLSDPLELFEKIVSLFPEAQHSTKQVALACKTAGVSIRTLFEKSPLLDTSSLWRVAATFDAEEPLEEECTVGSRQFSLKLVHVRKETIGGYHVTVYKKQDKEWLCCDDAQISIEKIAPLASQIYALVYESRCVSFQKK
jgi:ubiquitin C-terminal hydrolase